MSLPRLVATDLDGTLVRSDGTISPYTREVLDELDRRGVPVVFVTGTADENDARRPGSIIVHKPFDDAAIRQAVYRAMERAHQPRPIPAQRA